MSNFINSLQTKDTLTNNGMLTHSTSNDRVLDLFFRGGAMRNASKEEIQNVFCKAFDENPLLALKALFWIRDVRGGAGERKFFREAIRNVPPHIVSKNLHLIPEFGRWDDLLDIFLDEYSNSKLKKNIIDYIKKEILDNKNGLLCKWLPRKGIEAAKIRKALGWTPKYYRKTIVSLTNVVETKMCFNKWEEVEYKKVPSLAMTRYRTAFGRHDTDRFNEYNEKVISGEETINTGAIYPYDVVKQAMLSYDINKEVRNSIIAQWNNLPDYLQNSNNFRILPICDVSGSMSCSIGSSNLTALMICISLGVYISERNIGEFKDYFITFSETPRLQKLAGKDVVDKIKNLENAHWGMNTNLELVFEYILKHASDNNVSNDEMPTHLLILSDMEFDSAIRGKNKTAMELIKKNYAKKGYNVPNIIFWNLNSTYSNIPVKVNEEGVALVSGFSPSIFTSLLNGKLDPMQVMLDTIESGRYDNVCI